MTGTECVSASDFVRHFGMWQERAALVPVYIRHHGRPRFVLASIDYLQRLEATRARDHGAQTHDTLIDTIDSAMLLTDELLHVQAMSPPARSLLRTGDWRGSALSDLFPAEIRSVVDDTACRVRDCGMPETIELCDGGGTRRLELVMRRYGRGVAASVRDLTARDERVVAIAGERALAESAAVLGSVAIVHINLRGYVARATKSFEAMTCLAAEAVRRVRFTALFDLASRAAIGEALEGVMRGDGPAAIEARLLVNRGSPTAVRIGLSAAMMSAGGDAVVATLVRDI